MSQKLNPPEDFEVVGKDGAVYIKWNPVFGADGYKLFFYAEENPFKCIKSRYSQGCEKTVTGLRNNKGYLVEIRAFFNKNNSEVMSEPTRKRKFIPSCDRLKAQGALCLKVKETAQLICEHNTENPSISYHSENEAIASVSSTGVVTANSKGVCYIKITSSDGQTFRTKVAVERAYNFGEQKATLMFAGDIMCAVNHQKAAQKHSYDFFRAFENIRGTLEKADFAAGVLDPVCYDGFPYEHEQQRLTELPVKSNAPSTFVSAVASAGFGGVITSNDNCLGAGDTGLRNTVSEIKRSGMRNIGTYGDNPVLVEVKGFKVGIIACTMLPEKTDKNSLMNLSGKYDREYFVELINTVRTMGAEYIVAVMHWGGANSHKIRNSQLEEAKFIAESGADLIVGSHTHTVERFEYVETSGGKKVPCAYSLGNFLTTMSEMREHRDGAILRVDLSRENEAVTASYSYIPCFSEERDFGAAVVCANPPHNEECRVSAKRTRQFIGTEIKMQSAKPSVLLAGSSVLYRIFSADNSFKTDVGAMYLSPLSLGAENVYEVPEDGIDRTLALDISKDIGGYIENTKPDFVAVDFYTAATVSCFKHTEHEGCYYSNINKLRKSKFYEEHRGDWARIRAPFGDVVWKPLVNSFAKKLLEAIPSEKIILFRCNISSKRKKGVQLRTVPEKERQNRLMREMEDYFINLVHPAVVDLADKYFVEDDSLITFEEDYYADACRAANEIASGTGRTYIDTPDVQSWFRRAMKYYESMELRSYHKRLLDMENAADKLIAYTNVDFAARNSERIMRLKQAGKTDLIFVKEFFAGDIGAEELIRAAEIINLVEKGNLTKPYDFYAPAFNGHYNIVKRIARILSREIKASVDESSAELVFLLRGKPQLSRYLSALSDATVDIWGSCVSRESLNQCKNAFVGKYIYMQAAILSDEKPIEINFPESAEEFCNNKWRRQITLDAFNRNGFEVLEQSDAQWIVVDFYDLICPMLDYHGSLFESDDFLKRTGFYNKIKKDCTECYLFEKRDMKYCFDGITRFSNEILDLYDENIILIKTDPKNTYITQDFRLEKMDDSMFAIKKKFISLCEERFASITGCYVIDISKNFYSSDSYPLGGKHIVHYEKEFYRQTAEYITQIVRGTDQKVFSALDEDYILLRDLKLHRDK